MALYSDILLSDDSQDIVVGRDLTVIEDTTIAVKQRLKVTLLSFEGEWFLNNKFGIPYYQIIFVKGVTKEAADTIFRDGVLNTEGVISISAFSSTLNDFDRNYSVSFSCKVSTGDTIVLEI